MSRTRRTLTVRKRAMAVSAVRADPGWPLVAVGLMLVLLGGTALFVPLSPASAASGGVIVFVPLGPSSTAISVWQAHDLCTNHAGAVGSSLDCS